MSSYQIVLIKHLKEIMLLKKNIDKKKLANFAQ